MFVLGFVHLLQIATADGFFLGYRGSNLTPNISIVFIEIIIFMELNLFFVCFRFHPIAADYNHRWILARVTEDQTSLLPLWFRHQGPSFLEPWRFWMGVQRIKHRPFPSSSDLKGLVFLNHGILSVSFMYLQWIEVIIFDMHCKIVKQIMKEKRFMVAKYFKYITITK